MLLSVALFACGAGAGALGCVCPIALMQSTSAQAKTPTMSLIVLITVFESLTFPARFYLPSFANCSGQSFGGSLYFSANVFPCSMAQKSVPIFTMTLL